MKIIRKHWPAFLCMGVLLVALISVVYGINYQAIGPIKATVLVKHSVTFGADDVTPDVGVGVRFITQANIAPTAITDLDNPTVDQVIVIAGGSGVNATTIADAGNFSLNGAWAANVDSCLVLWVRADNDYVEIGRSDVMITDAGLTDIAALVATDGNFIVGDGVNWVTESGNVARTSLGLGTGDSPTFTAVTGANITSGVDPGHTHTGGSLGSIDISSDTNLGVTAPITLSGDTVGYDSWYDARLDGATGDGVTDDRANVATADGNTTTKRLVFSPLAGGAADYLIDSDITISSGVIILEGARISAGAGDTITFNGSFEAGNYQVFEGSGAFVLSAGSCDFVNPQWWGAVGDDATDNHDAIEAAITAAVNVGKVYLPGGIYRITSPIDNWYYDWGTDFDTAFVFQGASPADTIIKYTGASDYAIKIYNPDMETLANQKSVNYLTIRDMRIQASGTGSGGGGGIYLTGSHNTIENVVFDDVDATYGRAIKMEDPPYIITQSGFTNDTDYDFTTTGAGATEKYAISFTTASNVNVWVKSVTVRLAKTGSPAGTMTASIFTDSGGPNVIVNAVSQAVTLNNLNSGVDGADQTFTFTYADRPEISTATKYWLVLTTTGYTYTNGATEVRLRAEATAGGADTFGIYDFGGSLWSTTTHGANFVMNAGRNWSLWNFVDRIEVHNRDGTNAYRGFEILDNSQISISRSSINADTVIHAEGGPRIWATSTNFDGTDPTTKPFDCSAVTTGRANFVLCYFEGGGSSYPIDMGGFFRVVFVACRLGVYVKWNPGSQVEFPGSQGPLLVTDDPEMQPAYNRRYMIYTPNRADGERSVSLAPATTTTADADALTGTSWDVGVHNDRIDISIGDSVSQDYAFLPRGTYLVTVYAKADAALEQLRMRAYESDAGGVNLVDDYITIGTEYEPWSMVVPIVTEGIDYLFQFIANGSNNMEFSHITIEYLGPDNPHQRDYVAFNTEASDADGARESKIAFLGIESGGEQSYLVTVTGSHDGVVGDEKGQKKTYINDGGDGFNPTLIETIDSNGETIVGTMAATTVTGVNVTSGVDPGHTHSGGGGVTDHGALTGLDPDDDHAQYVLVTGTREMTGNLSLDKDSADIKVIATVYDDDATELPSIDLRKADNTEATPALVDDNDVLGAIRAFGYDGTDFEEGARIEFRVNGTPSDGMDMPTEITIWTTPDGSAMPEQRATFTAEGGIGLLADDPLGEVDIGGVNATNTAIVDAANMISLAVGGGQKGQIYVEGSVYAQIILDDSGGALNEQMVQLTNIGGKTGFDVLSDDGSISVANVILFDNTNGNVAFGDGTPLGNVDIGGVNPTNSALLTGGSISSLAVGGSAESRVYIQGSTFAQLLLDDSGGSVNEQIVVLSNADGGTAFHVIADNGVAIVSYMLAFDNANGYAGFFVGDPDTRVEIMEDGDQLKLSFDDTDNAVFAVDTNGDLTVTPSGSGMRVAGELVSTTYNYAPDTASDDDYLIALDPAPTAYTTGMMITFIAITANTGVCTVKVNALAVIALKMLHDQDPPDSYIEAGSVVLAVYDGTNFQMMNVDANP